MNRRPIASSVIAELGYDRQTSIMELKFRTGRVYRFYMIPAAVFEALLESESAGRYFNKEIRDRYPNHEVTEE
jgi:KTSC domain